MRWTFAALLAVAALSAAASAPNVIALPPQPRPGLDDDGGTPGPPLPDRPTRFPFKRVVFNTADSIVKDDYLVTLSPLTGGGLKGDFRFAGGEPKDRFLVELTPHALKEARALLTVQQGNEHLREKGTRFQVGPEYFRGYRYDATSFPFLPSQRLLAESLTGKIGPLTVGFEEKLPGLVRDGTRPFRLKLRNKPMNVTAERYVLADKSGEVELLLVRSLPGIGEVDLILQVTTYSHETVLLSLD